MEAVLEDTCTPHRQGRGGVGTCGNDAPDKESAAAQRIDLAHRRGDGIDVTLWWSPEDGSVSVEVLHFASESAFELNVDPARALEAFYHPFAYAARRSPELLEIAA